MRWKISAGAMRSALIKEGKAMTHEQIEQLGEEMKNLITKKFASKVSSDPRIRTYADIAMKGYVRGVDDMVRAFKMALDRENETEK